MVLEKRGQGWYRDQGLVRGDRTLREELARALVQEPHPACFLASHHRYGHLL